MRHTRFFLVLLAFITVLSSCKTNNDVVSHGILQKRKHLSGFHWSGAKQWLQKKSEPAYAASEARTLEPMTYEAVRLELPATDHNQALPTQAPNQRPLLASNSSTVAPNTIKAHFEERAPSIEQQWEPETWEKADFKKKSAIKKRSGWALFLSLMGSILFAFLAANFFVGLLTSGVLALTLVQLALLLGGLLLGWKHKDTNGASRAAFILSWIFLGLTGLFYFGLVVLGMF
jgi:hypothetical protein